MYIRCTVCQNLMNRRSFAQGSKVIVDVCRAHGTWFDANELPRIIEFTMKGGLEKAERAVHDALKAKELAAREAIVAEAEELAGRDPSTVQWKASSTRMNELFELWKAAQKNGPRLGRGTEDALWKRFSRARTTFDRNRGHYFSQLDAAQAEAKKVSWHTPMPPWA